MLVTSRPPKEERKQVSTPAVTMTMFAYKYITLDRIFRPKERKKTGVDHGWDDNDGRVYNFKQ